MAKRGAFSLRTHAPWRVLEGFGASTRIACRYAQPRDADEVRQLLERARREGLSVGFRGSGQSYGDAALNGGGLVLDLSHCNRVRQWDPATGVIECGPGVTIEQLWRHTLEDGYWPYVVPGTMKPTLGGCLSTNVHGKNNTRAGVFGEHVLDFDLLTPGGSLITCSPSSNADVFYAAIGGLGLLGAITRIRMELKPVETGLLRVEPSTRGNLDQLMDRFEELLPAHDYVVGWIDGLARDAALGRGELHAARYVPASEVADARTTLKVDRQVLPRTIFGIPASQVWRLVRPFMFNAGVRAINTAKYTNGRWHDGASYLQSHVAFAFLLDSVPDWRRAYGDGGFIQYQVFVPSDTARETLRTVLSRCHSLGLPPYLVVLKRHRPDAFLLSHGLDGWSLAMDFPISASRRADLWRLTGELTDVVLDAGGRFYFAKDAVLRAQDVVRAIGAERLRQFGTIKSRLDPEGILTSNLWRRINPQGT